MRIREISSASFAVDGSSREIWLFGLPKRRYEFSSVQDVASAIWMVYLAWDHTHAPLDTEWEPEELPRALDRVLQISHETPIYVAQSSYSEWYWLWEGRIYCVSEDLEQADAEAVFKARRSKTNQQIKRAHAVVSASTVDPVRQGIPDDVKIFVWQRDNGQCVRCGSNQNLEFDHIIPLSMGGANTARNLQLLCEPCNRAKGGTLA